MSTFDERWADQPEKRLARDAGEYPESLQGRADVPGQIAKDAGYDDVPGIHTDNPEQVAKDAAPEMIDRPVDVPEQVAKDAGVAPGINDRPVDDPEHLAKDLGDADPRGALPRRPSNLRNTCLANALSDCLADSSGHALELSNALRPIE